MKLGWIAAGLLITLTSCSSGGDEPSESVKDAASKVKEGVSSVTKAVEITEDNDPNNDIGRPGSYQAATVFYDSRAKCDDQAVVDVSCGAKIEVFTDEDGAKGRFDYLKAIIDGGGGLLTEYDYLDGNTLLRVSGELKPSEAGEYEKAFTE